MSAKSFWNTPLTLWKSYAKFQKPKSTFENLLHKASCRILLSGILIFMFLARFKKIRTIPSWRKVSGAQILEAMNGEKKRC